MLAPACLQSSVWGGRRLLSGVPGLLPPEGGCRESSLLALTLRGWGSVGSEAWSPLLSPSVCLCRSPCHPWDPGEHRAQSTRGCGSRKSPGAQSSPPAGHATGLSSMGSPRGTPNPVASFLRRLSSKKRPTCSPCPGCAPPRARTHGQRGSEALGEGAAWEGGQAGFGQQRGQAGLGTGGLQRVGGGSRASGGEGGGCLCQHRDRVSQSPKEGSPGAPEQGWGDSWCCGPAEGEVLPGFLLVQRPFAQTDSWA